MKLNEHYQKSLKISVYIIAGIYIPWLLLSPIPKGSNIYSSQEHFARFAKILTGLSAFWFVYYQWLWKVKWQLLQSIFFNRPNLSGTWMGYLKSNFIKNGKPIPPIKIVLFVRQPNFFDIHINSQTLTYAGFSFGEVLQFDPLSDRIRLLYQYSQKKTVPQLADDRQGAADLHFYDMYLAGHYWTVVNTSGFIRVHHLSREHFKSFEEADKALGKNPI